MARFSLTCSSSIVLFQGLCFLPALFTELDVLTVLISKHVLIAGNSYFVQEIEIGFLIFASRSLLLIGGQLLYLMLGTRDEPQLHALVDSRPVTLYIEKTCD